MSEQQQTIPTPPTGSEPQSPEFHYHHEAEKTELEKWLRNGAKKVEPYTNQILIGVIAIAVAAAIAIYAFRTTRATETVAWQSYLSAESPEDYLKVAENYPNGEVAVWAALQAGRRYLDEGLGPALTDRESSDKSLTNAKDAFTKVLNNANATDPAKADAIYGLATALEVLSGDDLSQAVEQYQRLIDNYPTSDHVAWAEKRIEELKKDSVIAFYKWFREQNPNPEDRKLPSEFTTPDGFQMPDPELIKGDAKEAAEVVPAPGVGPENKNSVPEANESETGTEKQPLSAPAFPESTPSAEPEPSSEKSAADVSEEGNANPEATRPAAPELPAPDTTESTETNPQ